MEIGNHFDAVVECCDFLNTCALDEHVTKQDVIDSMLKRMHILIKRGVCDTVFPYLSMSNWQIVTDTPCA
jgi:hypothetical protein